MPQRKVNPDDRALLERLLQGVADGKITLNASEIAQETGFSVSTVTAAAGKKGITFPKTGRRREIDHLQVLELLEQGDWPQVDIAALMDATPQAINNIQRRNKQEKPKP